MQRHISNKHGTPVFSPMYTVPNSTRNCQRFRFVRPFTCMLAGMTKSGLGEVFATAGLRGNSLTPGEDSLVVFTVAARVHGIASNHTKHRICQGYYF